MKTIFIVSGGTGGHIFPGLLLAKQLERDFMIYLVGNKNGMEYDIVESKGYNFLHIPSCGFVGKSVALKIKSIISNIVSYLKSLLYIKKYRPICIVGTGSFTEIPMGFAAKCFRIPLFITEQDSYPGVATKLLSRFADKVFLSYDKSIDYLRRKDNITVVGTLTDVIKVTKSTSEIKAEIGIPKDKKVLFIFGGSRGAKALNRVVSNILAMGTPEDIFIIWQTGKGNYKDVKKVIGKYKFKGVIIPFIYNMPEIYTVSDLVIARAGACTLAELSDYKKASILIPFPYAAHNHQMENAKYYEKNGAAIVIEEKNLDETMLKNKIIDLIYDDNRLKEMGACSHKLHNSGAVEQAVKIILRSI